MSSRRDEWDRYREAAVAGAAAAAGQAPSPGRTDRLAARAGRWWTVEPTATTPGAGRWRDLRLVPLGAAAWLGSALGPFVEAEGLLPSLVAGLVGCLAAASLAGAVLWGAAQGRRHGPRRPQLKAGAGLAALLACAALAATAGLAASAGHSAAERAGPVGELLAHGGSTVATVYIRAEPAPLRTVARFGAAPRFTAEARLLRATDAGRTFGASSAIRVVGGDEVRALRPGTTVEVAGRVVPATQPGRPALLNISTRPRAVGTDSLGQSIGDLRGALRGSSQWLWPDAAGLLPGMAVGDTAALPSELEKAMRDVGLGHLTAVSGANFTLLSGTVLLALRAARAPRPVALGGSAAVLAAFALVVGPEASVVRAAAMGAVGLVALMSGRAGRSCSSLSAAVLVLVLVEPLLAVSIGFLLSVAATLGIALLGPPLTRILAARLPAWLAVAVAVPLSAQLMCGPLVVLIQPSFLSLSLAANIAVSPFVPVVTVAGTLALATCAWCPPLALLCTAVGGASAQAVAACARLLAALPGAVLPWPEGLAGAAAMAVVSALNAAALWAAVSPSGRRAAAAGAGALASALTGAVRRAAGAASGLGRWSRHGRVDR